MSSTNTEDFYKILGVSRYAARDEVLKAMTTYMKRLRRKPNATKKEDMILLKMGLYVMETLMETLKE